MYPRSVPYENSPPRRDNIVTVAMPGLTSTRAQIARYTGPEGVVVLQNWADGYEPLQDADGHKNRNRNRTAWSIIEDSIRCFFTQRVACDDEVDRKEGETGGERAVTAAERHTGALAEGEERRARMEAADLGLIDPPVLYRATCRLAPRLLHNVIASPEVTECVHRKWYRTLNPVHWALVVKEIFTGWWFATRPFQLCRSELGRTNMGATEDQAVFTREVRRAVHKIESMQRKPKPEELASESAAGARAEEERKRHLVLFGVSRGAATCFFASLKLPKSLAGHVSLVIVEAPFDSLQSVINTSSWLPRFNRWFFKSFCYYRGERANEQAYSYNPNEVYINCPIAFVMSLRDCRVPNVCTQTLIDKVRSELAPHKIPAVEVLVLKHSRHPCMSVGHKEDQDAYVAFVERLYDTYCQ